MVIGIFITFPGVTFQDPGLHCGVEARVGPISHAGGLTQVPGEERQGRVQTP